VIEVTKDMLINAISGKGFSSTKLADEMEKNGLAKWTGNQSNESWAWNKAELEKLELADLEKLYLSI